jgi:hypothetical protein
MNRNRRRIATMLIFSMIALVLFACVNVPAPVPGPIEMRQLEYSAAQSTLAAGQSELMDLSHQATVVSLNMAQAANAEAQTARDYHQRQLMELSIRATEVSQSMDQAAAMQEFLMEQTQMAWDAYGAAQSQAATATYSAYIMNVTETAQAQAILDIRATETAQAIAVLTAIPRTLTPLAATQAAILFEQEKYQRQSNWGELITPLKIILTTLVILLLILGGVLAFRRFMPVLEFRLRNPGRNGNLSPLILLDGLIVDPAHHHHRLPPSEPGPTYLPQFSSAETLQIEIIGPSEPSIINWITEAEQKLFFDERSQG